MGVDREEVLRVADLARLELSDDEVSTLVRELDQILGHVEALELRTTNYELRTTNDGLRTGGGEQLKGEGAGRDSLPGGLEGLGPDFRDGFFRVPRLGSHADADEERE